MNKELLKAREDAARCIFESQSCLVDLNAGFELAIHQELPEAPRSPFYLNLRPEGVKNGKLSTSDIATISQAMYLKGKASPHTNLFGSHRGICSIPAAGDPYLDTIMGLVRNERKQDMNPTRYSLQKLVTDGKRSFILTDEAYLSQYAIKFTVVDDLVASSISKRLVIETLRQTGGCSVTDLLVFLNRSTDAEKELGKLGVRLHSVWDFEHLMEWALGHSYLKRHEYEIIMEYPGKLAAYKRSVDYVN